ncbi:amino acid permease/ SLC12A domain-containing protein [Rhodotorula diobovata]|uniref:Amino acid permease/ SLC12A domain-containing protein n=1 Tax=Rhodotorula diobovata TaxID=5288 RepID=A0A5C5FND4_9BASI|nr:amino acid permease/ SLC12A domain-containing protein [Rhodotorula diobovata]
MIALGGTIGTGLFVGAGSALSTAGAAGVFIGYTIMGAVVYTMMVALGEMTTAYPIRGAFVHQATRFLDPSVGFALGWNYWYSWAIIVAAALVLDYWPGAAKVNVAVWLTVFLVVITSFNFIGVRAFGEAEFWFSLIKIVTLLGLILLGIIITAGGVPGTEPIGFRYWHETPFQQLNDIPGAKGRFLSFWTVFLQASFSFLGTEIVALTAAEAENPRRNVPKAINRVFWRILFFYVVGVLVMSLIVSPNDQRLINGGSDAAASPWVIGIQRAGIKALPSIINAVILIAAFSAGNSDLYAASRTLYGMACDGQAPRIFAKTISNGLPIWSLVATALFGVLAYMNIGTTGEEAFNYLVAVGSVSGLINWLVILITYLRFYYGLKRQGFDRRDLAYQAPLQPYASYFGAFMMTIIIIFNSYQVFLRSSWDTGTFITGYICIPVFFILMLGYKFWKKTKFVRLNDMDFESGRRALDQLEEEWAAKDAAPKSWYQRVWDWIM